MPSSGTWLVLLAAAAVLMETGVARAEEEEEKVQVTVVAILATERHKTVNPKLKEIAREMHKINPKLTGFTVARETCRAIPVGREHNFKLADAEEIIITAQHGPDKNKRIGLKVKPPTLGEVVYKVVSGKY